MTDAQLLNIWYRMCRSREFDEQVYRAVEDKRVNCFVYLSSGQEAIPAAIAEAFVGHGKPPVFCQHRNHAAYISFGGNVEKLRDELLGKETGTTKGIGGDPMHCDPEIKFFGHSGLVADHVPQAVGYAFATRKPVVCFFGDSAVEEDVFMPALGFAATENLPVLFVCEDNGLSVVTRTEKRRSWSALKVARGYDIATFDAIDNPQIIYDVAHSFLHFQTPVFLEVSCCRKYRHVGIGVDNDMAWNRMRAVCDEAVKANYDETVRLESEAVNEMRRLWS